MNNLELLKTLAGERNKQNELKIIELVVEDLKQNSTQCLDYFLQNFCGVKKNKHEFYYYFWITYYEKAYITAEKPIKYFALVMWQKYQKDNINKVNTVEFTEKIKEKLVITDFEENLLEEIYFRQLTDDLSPDEKQIIDDILNGQEYSLPPSLKNKLKNKFKK